MSKFFAQGNISDEDNEDNSEDMQNANRAAPSYQYDFMDDDRGNIKNRVVRTEKEKKWNIVKDITVKIASGLNNQDYEKVWACLQDLLKEIQKNAKLIDKEGYPPLFLRCLKKINDEILQINENAEAKKKMKKHSATAFNTMKQKLKKMYPDYETAINELLAKGEEDDEDEESEEQNDQEDESEEEEDDKKLLESSDPMVRRKYWLKRLKRKESMENEEKDKIKDDDDKRIKNEKKNDKKKTADIVAPIKKKTVLQIQSIKDAENRIIEIRKNFFRLHNQEEREEYLHTLDKISQNTKKYKDFQKLSFLLVDIPIRIDVCRQMKLTHFPRAQLLKIIAKISQIQTIIKQSQEEDLIENIRIFDQNNSKSQSAASAVTEKTIYLSLKTYLILGESQMKKALTFIDSHDIQYYERLQDLIRLVNLMYKISNQLEINNHEKDSAQLAFKVLENTYFMNKTLIQRIKQNLPEQPQFLQLGEEEKIERYANLILRNVKEDEVKIKTLLYLIYNHAINHREKGKEILTISTIPDQITHQDYYTQALYNRTLVQIGLNAFRNGYMFEVQQFLYEMCSMAKLKENTKDVLKEFLAQGYSRLLNQKEIHKNKILPVYLHLNVDIIESVELIASMLLQLPYTLTEGGRITSKTFKRFYYEYERNYFIEESLNNRDLIYSASLNLKEGNWLNCYNKLVLLNIWPHIDQCDTTKVNLLKAIKEQSLKCYLIGNRKCFKSISLKGLSEKFDLEIQAIRKIICKLINEKILQGSITKEGYLIFVQKKQSQIQKICETLFSRLDEINKANQLWFSQKVNAGNDSEEQEQDKEEKTFNRKLNSAINQKLKSILSKRNDKF